MASPTQRTLKTLREDGWLVQVVERWNPYAKIRQDLYGFIDLLAIKRGRILGVQVTSGSSHAARVKKILATEAAILWLESGAELEVRSWRRLGKKGTRRPYSERIQIITPDDFIGDST